MDSNDFQNTSTDMMVIIAISFSCIIYPCNYKMNKTLYKKLSCNVLPLESS